MTYYNENDRKAAAWLRELIKEGHIPKGHVDERSIVDVRPHELTDFPQQHFFAGIGGWAYALRLAGWPDDLPVRTGSCPCQPFSQAGNQRGEADERHLWPYFRDIIAFGDPSITFGEQVASPLGREWLARVRANLENLGYEVGAADLCAASCGAPHIRQRLYWMAHAQRIVRGSRCTSKSRHQSRPAFTDNGSSIDGMVLANGSGRDARKSAAETERHGSSVESAGGSGGLEHPAGYGREQRRSESSERSTEPRRGAGGMGDSDEPGPQGRNERVVECSHQWPAGTPNLAVFCRDGKYRRFKPGAQPLASGVSNRVALLRGAGNSIVAPLAAEFIKAAIEALNTSPVRDGQNTK